MPNGHAPFDERNGYDERGWAVFRQQVLDGLRGFREWTEKHEREEFDHHAKVEGHMAETKAHIAAASVGRDEMLRRLDRIEGNERDLYNKLGAVSSRVWWLIGVSAVAGGISAILIAYLFQHGH